MRRIGPVLALFVVACGPPGKDSTIEGNDDPTGMGQCVGGNCMNFCPAGTATTISGVVTAPNGVDPIPHALVYVPRALEEFPGEVSCEICGEILSNAIVLTKTGADGTFSLGPLPTYKDQPPGATVQVIAQKGRFRLVLDLPIQAPCEQNLIADDVFRLPGRNEGQNTIPRIAVATGDYDAMECVLLRFGLEEGQFDLYEASQLGGLFGGQRAGAEATAAIPAKEIVVELDSRPSGALVEREGVTLGRTPLTVRLARSRTPTAFLLRKAGHAPFRYQVTPDRDSIATLELERSR